MYCSSCGAQATFGLRYCKRCGENLIDTNPLVETAPPPAPSRIGGAAWAIALATTAITLGGLGIVFSHVTDIVTPPPWAGNIPRHPGEFIPVAVPMIVFGTAAIFFIVFMLIRLFIRLMNLPPEPSRSDKRNHHSGNQYRPSQVSTPTPQQIQAPPMAVPSVTEHTTRNFDPVFSREHSDRE
jgi:hypothetical protein